MELFDFKPAEIKPTYVIFDPESGEIKRLTGDKQNTNCLYNYKHIQTYCIYYHIIHYKKIQWI
mgnify:CR=1 FL=1